MSDRSENLPTGRPWRPGVLRFNLKPPRAAIACLAGVALGCTATLLFMPSPLSASSTVGGTPGAPCFAGKTVPAPILTTRYFAFRLADLAGRGSARADVARLAPGGAGTRVPQQPSPADTYSVAFSSTGADTLYQVPGTATSRSSPGTWIATSSTDGSPATSDCKANCLGNLISNAQAKGRNIYLQGGGPVGTTYPVAVSNGILFQNQKIGFGPIQGKSIDFDYNTLIFTQTGTDDPGIQFDSGILFRFRNQGQIGYANNGAAMLIAPTNPVPVDGIKSWGDLSIDVQAIAATGGVRGSQKSPALVEYNLAKGGAAAAFSHWGELNGGGSGASPFAADGVKIHNTSSHSFSANYTQIVHPHILSRACVESGTEPTTRINGNLWDIANCQTVGKAAGSSFGHIEWGRGNLLRYGVIANGEARGAVGSGAGPDTGLGTGLNFERSARGNIGIAGYVSGYNTAAINFNAGSADNLAFVGYTAPYGGVKPFRDAGANNAVWQGATLYSASGLTLRTVDASGNQSPGSVSAGLVAAPPGSNLKVNAPNGKAIDFQIAGADKVRVNATDISGAADNTISVGNAARRMAGVYAVSYYAGGAPGAPVRGVSCPAGAVSLSTLTVTNGIVTHC